ncbi:MAG TPA: hypothetical protein VN824_19830 [Puia sp.]|nr:hypothetical protein [Puia sp.]
MNAARHKKKETAFKGVLILIGLALFIVQLSDKFYRFADKPFFEVSAKCDTRPYSLHRIFFLNAKPGLSSNCCFTPDRRWHSENGFALFMPVFFHRQWLVWYDAEFYTTNETTVWSAFQMTALRGPPGIISSSSLFYYSLI